MSDHHQTVKLYALAVEDFDDQVYDIVLPGRSPSHARKAADILLATTGTRSFKSHDLMAPAHPDLRADYTGSAPRLMQSLLEAYALLSGARAALRAEPELFEALEYQIDHARAFVRPEQPQLRAYLTQRALTRLPLAVRPAQDVRRPAANAFEAASSLPRRTISAAKAFSKTIEKDRTEIAALAARVREEYIQTRRSISANAKLRSSQIRAQTNAAFQPHYKLIRTAHAPRAMHNPADTDTRSIGSLSHELVLKTTMKAQQQALKVALKATIDEKYSALKRADDLYQRFHSRDLALATAALPALQKQWRALSDAYSRQTHAQSAPNTPNEPSFLERLGRKAAELREQTPAPEQDLSPEPK